MLSGSFHPLKIRSVISLDLKGIMSLIPNFNEISSDWIIIHLFVKNTLYSGTFTIF